MNISKINFGNINSIQSNRKQFTSSSTISKNQEHTQNKTFGSSLIETLPLSPRSYGDTITHALAENTPRLNSYYQGTLKDLIELRDTKEVAKTLTKQNQNGDTPIHIAARANNIKGLELFTENYPEMVEKTLTMKNSAGLTPVHLIVMNIPDVETIKLLSEKFPETVDKTLTMQDKLGCTPVSASVHFYPESKVFEYFCNQFSETTKKALSLKNNSEQTPVDSARFKSEILNQHQKLQTIEKYFPELL